MHKIPFLHRSRARAGACIYPGSALAGSPPRPRTNGTTTRWMVLASQVAAVLAVVISLLLLEAERALADGPQAGEDSEEQPDDAPDVETPLAKSACCHDLIFEACMGVRGSENSVRISQLWPDVFMTRYCRCGRTRGFHQIIDANAAADLADLR